MKTFIEAFYIIFMWNYFKTTYSFHNIWEAPLMDLKKMPTFFKHTVNTGKYESKICPLGNWSAFFLAAWVIFRDKINTKNINRFNKIIFFSVMILSFFMNLNAFIYFIPVFYYELYFSTF
jgi:hypothetical protein